VVANTDAEEENVEAGNNVKKKCCCVNKVCLACVLTHKFNPHSRRGYQPLPSEEIEGMVLYNAVTGMRK